MIATTHSQPTYPKRVTTLGTAMTLSFIFASTASTAQLAGAHQSGSDGDELSHAGTPLTISSRM